jgi:hypothetical protein
VSSRSISFAGNAVLACLAPMHCVCPTGEDIWLRIVSWKVVCLLAEIGHTQSDMTLLSFIVVSQLCSLRRYFSRRRRKRPVAHFSVHVIKPLTLQSPLVTLCTARFNIQQFYVLSTQCIYVFCVDLRTNSDHFPILIFITETESVHCAVRKERLYNIPANRSFYRVEQLTLHRSVSQNVVM